MPQCARMTLRGPSHQRVGPWVVGNSRYLRKAGASTPPTARREIPSPCSENGVRAFTHMICEGFAPKCQ